MQIIVMFLSALCIRHARQKRRREHTFALAWNRWLRLCDPTVRTGTVTQKHKALEIILLWMDDTSHGPSCAACFHVSVAMCNGSTLDIQMSLCLVRKHVALRMGRPVLCVPFSFAESFRAIMSKACAHSVGNEFKFKYTQIIP